MAAADLPDDVDLEPLPDWELLYRSAVQNMDTTADELPAGGQPPPHWRRSYARGGGDPTHAYEMANFSSKNPYYQQQPQRQAYNSPPHYQSHAH